MKAGPVSGNRRLDEEEEEESFEEGRVGWVDEAVCGMVVMVVVPVKR